MLERYLTLSPEAFGKLLKSSEAPIEVEPLKEAYRYSKVCPASTFALGSLALPPRRIYQDSADRIAPAPSRALAYGG